MPELAKEFWMMAIFWRTSRSGIKELGQDRLNRRSATVAVSRSSNQLSIMNEWGRSVEKGCLSVLELDGAAFSVVLASL